MAAEWHRYIGDLDFGSCYAGYILYNEKQDDALHGRLAEFRSECEQSVKDPLNPEAEFDPSISVRKRCFNEARWRFAKNMLAIDFGVVVFGWLAVWLGVVLTRLIRRRLRFHAYGS